MGLLRNIEHGLESVVEGVFGKVFRSHVQPIELAKKLAKEMDNEKTVSVSRVYVPNEYHLYLSPRDREQFEEYEADLLTELSDYLMEHARKEGYALLSRPTVLVRQDPELAIGEFGIATRMVQPHRQTAKPSQESPPGEPSAAGSIPPAAPENVRGEKPPSQPTPPIEAAAMAPRASAAGAGARSARAILTVENQLYELTKPIIVIGRSRECDISVEDASVSRHHAEIRRENGRYFLVDLGSTNGITVNGERVMHAQISPTDQIFIGEMSVTFGQGS